MATLACVCAEGRGATDRLLEKVVDRLRGSGVKVVGALRVLPEHSQPGDCESDLQLLPAGPVVRITQDLGPCSGACRMDAGALEAAVGIATTRLHACAPDIVVINKFGLSEAEGRGFRALISDALSRGMPVLVGVSQTHRAAFDRFADGMAIELSSEPDMVLDWCREVLAGDMAHSDNDQIIDLPVDAETDMLIEHIRSRFHESHRCVLPELVALARKVENDRPFDIDTPHGLADALEVLTRALDIHMRKEEDVVFPALYAGDHESAKAVLASLLDDHAGQEAALNRIAAITHGFRLPDDATDDQRQLYAGLGRLAEDMDEHRHLEDSVLFPRMGLSA